MAGKLSGMSEIVDRPPAGHSPRERLFRFLYRWVRLRFNGDQEAIEASMRSLVGIKNDKLWFLVASAVIASVGLNTNSPAVVIGAMLVSPLMGPIVGAGYALSIRDRRLAVKAGRHLLVSIVISLLVSTLYFAVSPLTEATSEILARTRPNLLDLMVALAAALAGVIALASVEMSATLPGVAIATAIMPPLCTVGYGLANGQWRLALGAFYLFAVNAVAIALCSFLLFRRMHVKEIGAEDAARMPRWLAASMTLVFLVPLSLTLFDTAVENRQGAAAKAFVHDVSERYAVANWEFVAGKAPLLTMFLFDQPTTAETEALAKQFAREVPEGKLRVMTSELAPDVQHTIDDLRNSLIDSRTALTQIQTAIQDRELKEKRTAPAAEAARLEAEWRALDERVANVRYFEPATSGAPLLVRADLKGRVRARDLAKARERYQGWLALRLDRPVELLLEPGK